MCSSTTYASSLGTVYNSKFIALGKNKIDYQKEQNCWIFFLPLWCDKWGRYHQEPCSQLVALKSQIFPVKNANLRSSGLANLVAKSSVFKTRQFLQSSVLTFKILRVFQSSFFTKPNLQTSQKPGYPPINASANAANMLCIENMVIATANATSIRCLMALLGI